MKAACFQSSLSSHPTFCTAHARGEPLSVDAPLTLFLIITITTDNNTLSLHLSATRRVYGSNNTKHPPSRPFRQSARGPREVVHWLRPATTRVRTATLGSARSARLCPIIHHCYHQHQLQPPENTTTIVWLPVVLPSTHRTAPLPLAAQACLLLPAPVQSALSSRYFSLRSLSPHVHPASLC